MRKLQVLMLLAGAGSRFANVGYKLPKPLINVDDQPMFLKALSSLDGLNAEKSYFFVMRQEQVDKYDIDNKIKQYLPEAMIIVIPELTRGAAESAMAAKDYLNPSDGLIIMDCDLWFRSKDYEDKVRSNLVGKTNIKGVLLTFESNSPKYSYAKLDNNGLVSETAEKKLISNHAITGAYYFSTAKVFIEAANVLLEKDVSSEMPEYYLSLLYNVLIHGGEEIQAAVVNEFSSFGTPEELEQYNKQSGN